MRLSVVIPAYNAARYIENSIRSVREQKAFPKESEIFVIDDGSSDETGELARNLGAIVFTQDHKGAASARNAGLKHATGEYILLLDADDMLTEGALGIFFAPFEKDPEMEAVFTCAREFFSEDLKEEDRAGLKLKTEPYSGTLPGCALLKRSVFEKVGCFSEELSAGETVDWMVRFRSCGIKSLQTNQVTLLRRIHANNTGRLYRKNEMANYAKILRRRMAEAKAAREDKK